MPNNNKKSNQGSVGHQEKGQSQGERGGYGNTSSKNAGTGQMPTEGVKKTNESGKGSGNR